MRHLFTLAIFLAFSASAQDLPHWMTAEEKAQLPSFLERIHHLRGTDPPAFKPRTSAEWEEIGGILVTWTSYIPILRQIVDYAQEECTVYIVCNDSDDVKNNLSSNGIPLYNIVYLEEPYNSIWCRDYGPWNIYRNDVEEHSLTDWIYNRPTRPKDDVIPQAMAGLLGLPIYEATAGPNDLVATGGNFMVDGHGTGFSSELIVDENGVNNDYGVTEKTVADIDTIMKKFLGLDRYVLMETLPYDDIHHIDMHMKLLDEETLLVGEFPQGVSDGPQMETNLQYVLDNYLNCFGRPYNVVRIPMVPSTGGQYPPSGYYRTYTNSVFINKTILVPTYREEYDTTALRIYRESCPGYKVYGIDCDNSNANIIAASGAIHCITKEVGMSDPVWISHAPLLNTAEVSDPYEVLAKIKTPSGVMSASLYWTLDTSMAFTEVIMNVLPGDSFYAFIPAQPAGTEIFYYITAESNSGRTVSKPLPAPEGWWHFFVEEGTANNGPLKFQLTELNVFPNPVSTNVVIGFILPGTASGRLYISDIAGRNLLVIENASFVQGLNRFEVPLEHLAAGLYQVLLETPHGRVTKPLIVKD